MKGTKGSPSPAELVRQRDESVSETINGLLENIDEHIKDKFIFPKIVAHAVALTMAQMVNMASIAHIQKMENWLVELEGSTPDEWDSPGDPLLPPIDTWARATIPIRKGPQTFSPLHANPDQGNVPNHQFSSTSSSNSSSSISQVVNESQITNKQPRRGSILPLSPYLGQEVMKRRLSEVAKKQGLRGSLRRFSDNYGILPSELNRKVKFQEDLHSNNATQNRNNIGIGGGNSTLPALSNDVPLVVTLGASQESSIAKERQNSISTTTNLNIKSGGARNITAKGVDKYGKSNI